VTSSFDPIAVGDQIAAYEAEAGKARGFLLDFSKKSAALLLDVQQNHPDHLEAICSRVGISRSRRYELLAIAGGRRTEEENRQISKDRQDRKRAKDKAAKAKTLPPPKPEPESVTVDVTDSPEAPPQPPPPADDGLDIPPSLRRAKPAVVKPLATPAKAPADASEASANGMKAAHALRELLETADEHGYRLALDELLAVYVENIANRRAAA
jgi:hypothetical protein